MSLAEQLKFQRKKSGFSQIHVAEKLNISRQSISKWENGRGYPDIDNLVLLSKVYEVSIDELLHENDKLREKIMHNETEIESKRETLKFIKGSLNRENDEGLILLVIAAISCLLFPLGLIIVPVIIYRNKKTNTLYKLVYIVCICSFAINLFDTYGYLGNYFNWGETQIEKIK